MGSAESDDVPVPKRTSQGRNWPNGHGRNPPDSELSTKDATTITLGSKDWRRIGGLQRRGFLDHSETRWILR